MASPSLFRRLFGGTVPPDVHPTPGPSPIESAPEPPPAPPPADTIDGPYHAIYAVMTRFAAEAKEGAWATGPNPLPLRWERLQADLGETASGRLRRLRAASEAGSADALATWLKADLSPYLEQLCGHLSDAADAALAGNQAAIPTLERLRTLLFRELGDATRQADLFAVQPVTPYVTEFDPECHHAAGGRAHPGMEGRVVRLVAAGRLAPTGRQLLVPAQVVVGK